MDEWFDRTLDNSRPLTLNTATYFNLTKLFLCLNLTKPLLRHYHIIKGFPAVISNTLFMAYLLPPVGALIQKTLLQDVSDCQYQATYVVIYVEGLVGKDCGVDQVIWSLETIR